MTVLTRLVDLRDLQPSQLYISEAKLDRIERKFDTSHPQGVPPVPIVRLDGRWMLTDGHTRAFALYRSGAREVRVIDEPDALDWTAYRVCVDWCLDEGIEWVGDLAGRMLPPREFEQLWLLRCRRMQEELARLRGEG